MGNISDMTVGSPTRKILGFALPLILGYILQQLYLIIDAAIVGRFIGVRALAAVGASSSIMFLIMGFCNGACAGFAIPVAQSFGAKDYRLMRSYVSNALRLSVVIAVVMTALTCAFSEPILHLVSTPREIFRPAWVFLLLNFMAIPFTMGYNILAGFIRALGNSKQPFYFLIFSSVVNVVLDFLLIIVIGLGVEGAGLATLLSQACSMLLCADFIRRRMQLLIPRGSERRRDRKRMRELLSNGVPMGLQFSITGIGIIMLQSSNNALGTLYVAAFTASMRVKYLFTCVFENIGVAMATYCGQNIGARNTQRVKRGVFSAIKIMGVFYLFTFVVIQTLAPYMMELFVDRSETAVIDNAALFMRICNWFYPVLGLLTIFRYSIQGLGYSTLSMMSGVMEMIARCAVSLWLVPAFGFLGVCYGDPMAWIAADLFLIPAFIYVYRRLSKRYKVLETVPARS